MTSRERILATLTGKKVDRTPYISGMGFWGKHTSDGKKRAATIN